MRGPGAGQLALAVALLAPAQPAWPEAVKDPYFGEALYYAHQERYFDALERLDAELAQHYRVDEPELDTLYAHLEHAEFSVGDFELHYRMHHRAGRAIRAVLEADVPEPVRNEAAFRLARLHFQKGQPRDALHALERVEGRIPEDIRDEVEFLRANAYMAVGRSAEAAEVLRGLQGSPELKGFTAYNLGIALLQAGRPEQALEQLDRAGRVKARDRATLAIRDKANLVLGMLLFEASAFGPAQRSLDRVRVEGPFSNQALLRAGWADASAKRFERALVPWSILAQREATDAAVQEAMLALPYAYSKLDVHGRAALLYGHAVETYTRELEKVDASIRSVREGRFLEALVREEIRRDKDWVVLLRSLPNAPETFYLLALMASHDFHTALQNYLDLEDLRKRLVAWQGSLDAFEDLLRIRREYYEPLLPGIDRRFRQLDAQVRLRMEQREHLDERLQHMLIAPRPDLLATAEEQALGARLEELESALGGVSGEQEQALRRRLARLRGALTWSLETGYHERLTEAHENLRELNADVDALEAQYEAFVRTRQAATHSYAGYETRIRGLRTRIVEALGRLGRLQTRQGEILESVAIGELVVRRDRLEVYRDQARFAFAQSYDRAARAQAQ